MASGPESQVDGWSTKRLSDLASKIGSGATPSGGSAAYLNRRDEWVLIRSQNVFDRRFDADGLAYISDEQARKLSNAIVHPGDILLNITGDGITFARACLAPEGILPAVVNQHVSIIRTNPVQLDPGYLLSFLTCPSTKRYIESFNAGGSRRAVTKGHIESFQIPMPPISIQRAIGVILASLDDKIELNRRMSETLEATARALFKSWFIDFDSVADRLDRTSDWPDGSLADFAVLNAESWSRANRPRSIAYVDLSNTKWGRIESITRYDARDAPSRAQRVLRPGDTIVGTVRPGNGSYAFIAEDGLTGSTGFAVLRPRKSEYAEFAYLAATNTDNIERLAHLADGAAYPAVRPEVVIGTEVPRADDAAIVRFSECVAPLLARIAQCEREAHTLADIRDILLPKLISGELRIKDAERSVSAIA